MKKQAVILAAVAALVGCSGADLPLEGENISPKPGQYVATSGSFTAALVVGDVVGLTIWDDGSYIYQDLRGRAEKGGWPTYVYEFDKLILDCTYTSLTAFTANVEANGTPIQLPSGLRFSYDSRVLDANGDGILDSAQ